MGKNSGEESIENVKALSTEVVEDIEILESKDVDYVLKQPITFEGRLVEKIYLKFSALKGRDLLRAESTAKRLLKEKKIKEPMTVPETNKTYLYCVAAKASNEPIELFEEISAADLTSITLKAQAYLLGGEEEEEEI